MSAITEQKRILRRDVLNCIARFLNLKPERLEPVINALARQMMTGMTLADLKKEASAWHGLLAETPVTESTRPNDQPD